MWQPDPAWQRLPGGSGPSTGGVWWARWDGSAAVVKRLVAPRPGDPEELSDPTAPAWWRREAEVARTGALTRTPGLRSLPALAVEEDDTGITLVHPVASASPLPGLFVARSLGRFAGADLADPGWWVQRQLRTRLARVAARGGWQALADTPVAEVAAHVWRRRHDWLDAVDALPTVVQHGDPVPGNMLARSDDDVLAVDWSTLGRGPVGADLGYWSLSAREELEPLLEAYLGGLPAGMATREEALTGARVCAAYTVLSRADRALVRTAQGDGALGGRLRHPEVLPHLRTLQRQLPQMEALVR